MNQNDKDAVGALGLVLALLLVLLGVAASLAVGNLLGAAWGWLAAAAFIAVCCAAIVAKIHAIARRGRDDG